MKFPFIHPTLVKVGDTRRLACVLLALVLNCAALRVNNARSESPRPEADLQQQTTLPPESLEQGQLVTEKINGGQTRRFSASLKANELAEFTVEEQGSILLASLYDPDSKLLISMDSGAGGFGPIYFSIIVPASGTYRLDVTSTNEWALPADFKVLLAPTKDPTAADRLQVAAHSDFAAGRTSFRNGKPQDAIKALTSALNYWQTTQNYHWLALTNLALAEAYALTNELQQRRSHLEEALKIAGLLERVDWRIKASALNNLGGMNVRLGQLQLAFDVLDQALSLFAANNDQRGQASTLNQIAQAYNRAGDFALARESIEKAMDLRLATNDKPGASGLINGVAVLYDRLGEPDRALEYSFQALRNWEEVGEKRPSDRRAVAAVLTTIAVASDKLGKLDQALEYYEKALAKFSETDPLRASTLDSMGELYAALGDPVKAREYYDKAVEILDKTKEPDVDDKAGILVHIGQLSLTAGDAATAIKWFEQARNLKPSQARLTDVLTNLGSALAVSGNSEQALRVYQTTLDIQTELKNKRGQALTLQKRGEAYMLQRKLQDALNDFKAALPLWQIVKDQRGEASTFNNIARVERARGNLSEALENNKEAIRIVESLRTGISSRQLRTSYFATRENYYELDIDLQMQLSKIGNRDRYVTGALEANERARARVLLEALHEAGVDRSTAADTSDPRFSSMMEQRLRLLNTMAAKAQARTRLLSGAHSAEQIGKMDRELRALSNEYDELQTRIKTQNPKFAELTRPEPASLQEIQQQLDDNTSFIEYSLGEPRSYAWVINRDSIAGFELKAGSEIETYAQRLKEALSARGRVVKDERPEQKFARVTKAESDYVDSSALLSEAVLAPLAAKLIKKRLLIVADGTLQLLPFAVLPRPETVASTQKRLMIEKHELISLPSASVLVLQRKELANRTPAPYSVAMIADPVFGESDERAVQAKQNRAVASSSETYPDPGTRFEVHNDRNSIVATVRLTRALGDSGLNSTGEIRRLQYSGREALAILRLVSPNSSFSALGFDANRATLLNPKLSQFRMIHLATHGVMDLANPELSGVLLSMLDEKGKEQNGYIGLSEIYNLDLPADLVVLSACETGTGREIKGEGLIALTRGFMYAGAERLVASLWRVDDEATALLMASFYEQMLVKKLKPAAALREAQRQLSQQKKWRNPHYWAGFVIQGEWR